MNLIIAAACLSFGTPQAASAQNRIVASTHHVTREVDVASFAHIRLNGSSDVKLSKVQAQVLNGSVSGSGDLSLSGRTEEPHYQLMRSGNIAAPNLKARHVTARIPHGSSEIRCQASESIVMIQKRNGRLMRI